MSNGAAKYFVRGACRFDEELRTLKNRSMDFWLKAAWCCPSPAPTDAFDTTEVAMLNNWVRVSTSS